jgi:hypothetical protein
MPSIGIQELEAIEQRLRPLKAECDAHHKEMETAYLTIAHEIARLKAKARGQKPPEPPPELAEGP